MRSITLVDRTSHLHNHVDFSLAGHGLTNSSAFTGYYFWAPDDLNNTH